MWRVAEFSTKWLFLRLSRLRGQLEDGRPRPQNDLFPLDAPQCAQNKKYGSCFSAYIYYVQIFFLSKLYYFGSADFTTTCVSQSDKRPSVHIPAFSPTVQAVLCKLFSFWQGVSNVLCEYYGYDLPLFWKDFLSNHSFCTSFKTHKWP